MNTSAIYSKTGKGVQEASGKTSQLSRGDRAILSAIDGKINLKDLSAKFDRAPDDKFLGLIKKLDADGFIREVNPGVAQRGAANAPRPAAGKPPAPSGKPAPPSGAGEELDFTQIFSTPPKQEKTAAPAGDPMAAARHEAEMRQRAEREAKAKAEAAAKVMTDAGMKERLDAEARAKAAREASMQAAAEGKTKAEIEARSRAEAEARAQAALEARARVEAETARKAQEARDAQARAEREASAKVEAAEKARRDAAARAQFEAEELRRKIEEERRAREAEEKARREAEELRSKLDEERKAREAAEHRAREERERALEDAERRAREDVERKAREERDRREQEENQRQIRMAREAEDKKRRDADARKRKEQETRRWQEEEARRKSDDGYRQRAEQEDKERAEREAAEAVERAQAEKNAAEAADALSGSLMADLDSFSKREEEERKEKHEQDQRQRAEMQRRAQEEEARREQEEAERRARKEEDKRRKAEEEARRVQEEEERQAEAKAKEEEAEKKKKEREAEARKAAPEDIPISRADLGRDDVADDERKLTPEARKALRDREREVARARDRGDQPSARAAKAYQRKQPVKWGKPVALALFFLLVGGVGVVNFLPLSTAEYEKLASDAVGAPVKIGSARMWVLAGVQMRFERVTIGESIRIAEVRAVPELGSLLDDSKAFSRVEVDKVTLPQEALGGVLIGAMQGSRLRVGRVVAKEVKLEGPLALPVLDADAAIGSDGRVYAVRLSGERVSGLLTPRGDGVAFEVTLGSFTVPFLEKLSISDFGMKGSANRQGMTLSEFDGRLYDGTVVGKGRIQWGAQWNVQGEIQGRAMNAAVFSPQLVSEGRFEGKGRFAMAGPDPAKLNEGARLDGSFTVTKGALGSFDLSRALQSTSAQASGRTPFSEFAGSVALANGALAMRDLKLSSGLLNASGSMDVDASGGLSGRVNAELRNLRGTFYIGGKLGEPQLRR